MKDPWDALRRATPARIALGRSGTSLPTHTHLEFSLDHARAKDAVHRSLDTHELERALSPLAPPVVRSKAAGSRGTYLMRPDLGRELSADSELELAKRRDPRDLAIVVGDGLSAGAAERFAPSLVKSLLGAFDGRFSFEIVIALGARVALADRIGVLLGARASLILLGERPGLTVPESLGAYLTFEPRVGRNDAERNCVSNIHERGLSIEGATRTLDFLVRASLARGLSGIGLKDESRTLEGETSP